MKYFNKFTIRTKILVGFIFVSLITGFIGFTGYKSRKSIMKNQYEIADVRLPSVASLLILSEAQTAVLVGERGLFNTNMRDTDIRNAQYAYIEAAFKRADEAWNTYAPLPQSEEEAILWKKFIPEWNHWKEGNQLILDLSKEKDRLIASGVSFDDIQIQKLDEQVYEASMNNRKPFITAESTLNQIIDINMAIAKESSEQGKITYENTRKTISISIFLAVLLSILLGFIISIRITKPINKTIYMLKDIAEGEGDLTKRLDVHSKDEVGELAKYFNLFIDNIQELVSQVKYNADNLAESSSQISLTMDQNNKGIEEIAVGISQVSDSSQNNASVVEEITASIEELASSTEIISQESKNAFQSSSNALKIANQGAKNIKEVVSANNTVQESTKDVYEAIGELKVSSDKIGEIVSIITNISEQTNLLSLNAAIEAARAGEHGKGFAVVADEVRKLAEESKESALSINSLIGEIQIKADNANTAISKGQEVVEISVEKSNVINEHFKNILDSIEDINGKIEMISDSSNNQSQVAEEITKAMDEISVSTQDNASSVEQMNGIIDGQVSSFEEIGASVEELRNVAFELKDKTDQFNVD
ncbi:methyl-accepting chemotaxis protein [Tepidibacter hydrothermalis]|uniref:Methyl-accepting chemotaxis protein n=1 Tax=Tepidibacter hydrothermalis TaxID=3036126 RepID=A0ABY8EA94_9FIRM|nr:methyl-accepting chemotaxis protein [Tepidibacter hydrothermalis]WFD09819.1 methyl-accepting chemotaxis protein [Tepidibacter hydrothermalis]